ncbi:MAG: glycosyltransferase [Planctomycetes bacterium]|nr:glycosyltransferase [Planctomycetota bacterium]
MRILHAIHSFPPDSHGGTETYVRELAAAQQARGDAVAIVAGSDRVERRDPLVLEREEGLDVWRLRPPPRGLAQLVGVDEGARASLEAVIERTRPQLFHLHHWHNLTSDAIAVARRRGAAAVVTLHDLWASCPLFFRLPDHRDLCPTARTVDECARCVARLVAAPHQALLDRFAQRRERLAEELRLAGIVLALSLEQRDWLRELLGPVSERLVAAPLPAPRVASPPPRRERAGSPRRLVVATWGALDPGKGLGTLVEAAERLPDPARVAIHHHGRLLDAAERAAVERAARRVTLTLNGPYTASALAEMSADADVAVFASRYFETHGLVVDEALALGLPVLVADRGAPAARVGARGRVFRAGDAEQLARLLHDCLDGDLLTSLRQAARPALRSMADHLVELDRAYAVAAAAASTR